MTGEFIVAEIKQLDKIEGADKIVSSNLFGETIITSTNTKVGIIGLLFDIETVLSLDLCKKLNLHRHSELNDNKEVVGYFDDTRRVKPIKLKGVKCTAFFLPLDSIEALTGIELLEGLKVGVQGNDIGEYPICTKYLKERIRTENKQSEVKENLTPTFKEHMDTDQALRNIQNIQVGDLAIITSKMHGTSTRCGYLPTKTKLSLWHQFLGFLTNGIWETHINVHKFVVGSRRVVKSISGNKIKKKINWDRLSFNARKDQINRFLNYNLKETNYELYRKVFPTYTLSKDITLEHIESLISGFKNYFEKFDSGYYNNDLWSTVCKREFEGKLNKGETIFGEIVGYDLQGGLIMSSQSNSKLKPFMDKKEYKAFIDKYGDTTEFTYGCYPDLGIDEHTDNLISSNKIYVYRITTTNEDGVSIDLSWEQVKMRCEQMNVNHVHELDRFIVNEKDIIDGTIENSLEVYANTHSVNFPQHLREGVCLRLEGASLTPKIYKNKGYNFKVLESIIKESDIENIEENN